jgi:hypothetical protein
VQREHRESEVIPGAPEAGASGPEEDDSAGIGRAERMAGHIRERLEAYLEQTLEPSAQAEVERHIVVCGSCRAALEGEREARRCMDWLLSLEAPPQPGPDFYVRVEQSIDQRLSQDWFSVLAAAMRPRLAYPVMFLLLLAGAWGYTYETASSIVPVEEGLTAMEYPAAEFTDLSFSHLEREASEDVVMMSLVALPEGL